MKRTYIDSTVLIAAATGRGPSVEACVALLNDPDLEPVSSAFVALEILPAAKHNKRAAEFKVYSDFLENVEVYVEPDEALAQGALEECLKVHGLAPMDALHLVAAQQADCDELVTVEDERKPMFRSRRVKVRRLA